MSDAKCGVTADQISACITEYGPELSAHELAHLLHVSVCQIMCALNNCIGAWWTIEARAWDGPGFRYGLRKIVSKRLSKPPERAKEWANERGTIRSGDFS